MSRVKRSDGEATHSKILESAGKLIAKHGFAQTSNKMIAKKADVDLAAINYHFGGRDKLYSAVLSEAHQRFIDSNRLTTLTDSDLTAHEKFSLLIDSILENLQQKSNWASQIFLREMLTPSPQFDQFFKSDGATKLSAIKKIICDVSGINENDPRVILCMLNISSPLLMMLVTDGKLFGPLTAISKMEKSTIAEHLKLFALAGLEAVAKKV